MKNQTGECKENCIVKNGNWNKWSVWSNCSTPCGEAGTSMRTRTCEPPQNGGLECLLSDNTTRGLNENQTSPCYYYCPSKYQKI